MQVHQGYGNVRMKNPVATLGAFDGVHRGHKALLGQVIGKARETGGESAVITFSPHPKLVLERGSSQFSLLTTLEEKEELLRGAGIDHLIILEFNLEFSNTGACEFVRDVLISGLGIRHLIIGYDHRFGRQGEGDMDMINSCGHEGFTVEKADGIFSRGIAISSSLIRDSLLAGRIDEANEMLGYEYLVSGTVIEGKRLGRSFGFPTANIRPAPMKLIPSNGVYAVRVYHKGSVYPGMLSIGFNPTVSTSSERSIEVNIIGFDGDIYGDKLEVGFVRRLRDEQKFASIELLAARMELDRIEALRALA